MKYFFSLLAIILFAGCNENPEAGRGPSVNQEEPVKSVNPDSAFLADAYLSGLTEIQLADNVKNRLGNSKTKDLAGAMITAHATINDRIKALAEQKNIILPDGLNPQQKEELLKNDTKNQVDFDKAYADQLIESHTKAVTLFEKASGDAMDADVKKFFNEKTPEIRHHLEMAREVRNALK